MSGDLGPAKLDTSPYSSLVSFDGGYMGFVTGVQEPYDTFDPSMGYPSYGSGRGSLITARTLGTTLLLSLSPSLPLSLHPSLPPSLSPSVPQEKLSSSPLYLWLTTPPSLFSNPTRDKPTRLDRNSLSATPPPLTTITTVTLAPLQWPTTPCKCTMENHWSPWSRTTVPPTLEVSSGTV